MTDNSFHLTFKDCEFTSKIGEISFGFSLVEGEAPAFVGKVLSFFVPNACAKKSDPAPEAPQEAEVQPQASPETA